MALLKMQRYRVTREFTVLRVQSSEGFAADPRQLRVGDVVFADLEFLKGQTRAGIPDPVQVQINDISSFYCADREAFENSTEPEKYTGPYFK